MAVRTRMTENPTSNQRDSSPQRGVPVPVPVESVILGVDTHKDVHAAAVITAVGVLLDTRSFPASAHGYQQLLSWARGFGTLRRAGVEGRRPTGRG